jgi:hypothetical protein
VVGTLTLAQLAQQPPPQPTIHPLPLRLVHVLPVARCLAHAVLPAQTRACADDPAEFVQVLGSVGVFCAVEVFALCAVFCGVGCGGGTGAGAGGAEEVSVEWDGALRCGGEGWVIVVYPSSVSGLRSILGWLFVA